MSIHANQCALGELLSVRAGYAFRGSIAEVADGPVRAVQMKDVDPFDGVTWPGVIRTRLSGRRDADWLVPGDIVFVSRGTRFYAVCVEDPPESAVCGAQLFHLRVRAGSAVLPAFVAWQINQPPFQRQLQRAAEGTSQRSVRRPILESLSLAVPSLADQARIADLAALARRERQVHALLLRNRERLFETIAEGLMAPPAEA